MIIRSARPADSPQIAALWNRLIVKISITFTLEAKTIDVLETIILARAKAFQVFEQAGSIFSFATFFQFRHGPGYARTMEHSIVLAPEAQGTGHVRRLMAALEDEARQLDVHLLWAAVSGENRTGVAFHQKNDFKAITRLPQVGYKFGRWMDLVLLQKIL